MAKDLEPIDDNQDDESSQDRRDGANNDIDVDLLLEQAGLIRGAQGKSPGSQALSDSMALESAEAPGGGKVVIDELGERVGGGAREGYSESDDMLRLLAEEQGMEFVDLDEIEIDQKLIEFFSSEITQAYKIFPVRKEKNGTLVVALADPLNVRTLDDLELLLGRRCKGAIAREESIERHLEDYYSQEESVNDVLQTMGEADLDLTVDEKDFGNLEDIANQPPIIKLVNLLLLNALKERASDLHVEPFQNSFRIRYRVDGSLHETIPPPPHLRNAIISRIKVMAGMNIAERRMPQDGRISLSMQGRAIDLRVSCLPTVNGESIVMRILDRSMMMIGLENIGMMPSILNQFERIIRKPHGIILVTGPTGSGKTTTLYAVLRKVYSPEQKFITTEEPVEYELDGVVQVSINTAVGLTFAACLRSILRQDPDVIMVGEIRDVETAQIAIEASLTGHLVLSTLHTNDAPSTLTRLVDMEVEPFLLTSTLECVLAQRLVRLVCDDCKEPYQPAEESINILGFTMEQVKDVAFYRGAGCAECNYIGYKSRLGIFEMLVPTPEIRELVLQGAPSSVINRKAIEQGMRTLRQDGWEKVVRGLTTVEEVLREA